MRAGEVVALLGHNGAGKTVTVRLLSTLAWPTAGTVRVAGHDTRREPVAVRRVIGVCLDQPLLWPDLTGYETLRLLADAYGVSWAQAQAACSEVLDGLRLPLKNDRIVAEYSLGMKRKLGLAAAFCTLRRWSSGTSPRSDWMRRAAFRSRRSFRTFVAVDAPSS